MMKKIGTLMVAVSTLAVANAANAFEYTPYVGLDYTYSTIRTKGADGFRPDYHGASVNAGVNYNKFFGTELFYQRTGKDNKHWEDGTKEKSHLQAYGLDLMGYLPLYGCEAQLSLVGTVGVGIYDYKYKITPTEKSSTDNGIGYRYGLGLQYKFNDHVSVRGLARRVEIDKIQGVDRIMEYVLGARYSF